MKVDNSNFQQSYADFQSLMYCVESNQDNFNILIRLMRRNVVVPFIGAGFSANFGYPLWEQFLQEQAKSQGISKMNSALKCGNYEKAASMLKAKLGVSMEYTLTSTCSDYFYQASEVNYELEKLPKVFNGLMLTTNFDRVIEMLYAKVNSEPIEKVTPKLQTDVDLMYKRIACGEATLIKLHGDVAMREFVLTEEEYNKIYGENSLDIQLPLPAFLRDVLVSKTILFLGCSLQNDRTLQVLEQAQVNGSISFALIELPKETVNKDIPWEPKLTKEINGKKVENSVFTKRKAFLYAHNIIPIWFPYKEYDALKIFLSEVASQLSTEYTFSVTRAQSRVAELFKDGSKLKQDNTEQAFCCYAGALEIIKTNPDAFVEEKRLDVLNQIRSFYDINGFECKELIKEIIALTRQIYSDDSVELARCYHDIGYTYEKYLYYPLMLKAMWRSQEILQRCEKKLGKNASVLNAAAHIYIGLAYAFLKNGYEEKAKEWYQKAETLLINNEQDLHNDEKSFVYNGLYRYYKLLKNRGEAIITLEKALKLRRELYWNGNLPDDIMREVLNHIINTHSNKIRIYLEGGQVREAENEFQFFKNEYPIWDKMEYLRSAKCRILTDHGDILMSKKEFGAALGEYKEALKYRKYLHYIDDFSTADLYLKIANNLKNISNRYEEAMEYMIQAYVLYEKIASSNSPDIQKIMKESMEDLRECLLYSDKALEQRLSAQREFFQYRHDERLDNRQNELIEYLGL